MNYLLHFAVILTLAVSCRGDRSSSAKATPNGDIDVNVTTDETEDPLEFKQADESVQIGGVNLTTAGLTGTYEVTAHLISHSEPPILILTRHFNSPQFRLNVRASGYLIIAVTGPQGLTHRGLLPPAYRRFNSANITLGRRSSVAAKIMEIIANKSIAGDSSAKTILANYAANVTEIQMIAASAVAVEKEQRSRAVTVAPIDISSLSQSFIDATMANVINNQKLPISIANFAVNSSEQSLKGPFGPEAKSITDKILAFRTSMGLPGIEIAYEAIKQSGQKLVQAAWQSMAEGYRTAENSSSAADRESSVDAAFETLYTACVSSPSGCLPDSYSPPSAPSSGGGSSSSATFTSGSGSFTVPAGVTSMTIELWGGGGGGGGGGETFMSDRTGDGGGGGAYCKKAISVSGGALTYTVGSGGSGGVTNSGSNAGSGGTSSATYSASTFSAGGGTGGKNAPSNGGSVSGLGGVATGCDENRSGGTGSIQADFNGGGGGSSGASGSDGVTASATSTGATAPSGGGSGGNGGSGAVGSAGSGPGGGGGGGGKMSFTGGAGGSGQVKFTW